MGEPRQAGRRRRPIAFRQRWTSNPFGRYRLERDIVIRAPRGRWQFFHRGSPGRAGFSHLILTARSPLALALSLTLSLAIGAPEQLDFPGNNVGKITLLALRVFPLVGPNTAFNIDLPPFGEVVPTEFSRFAEGYDAVPLGSFLPVAFSSGNIIIGGEVEFGDCNSIGAVANIRISPQSAD